VVRRGEPEDEDPEESRGLAEDAHHPRGPRLLGRVVRGRWREARQAACRRPRVQRCDLFDPGGHARRGHRARAQLHHRRGPGARDVEAPVQRLREDERALLVRKPEGARRDRESPRVPRLGQVGTALGGAWLLPPRLRLRFLWRRWRLPCPGWPGWPCGCA